MSPCQFCALCKAELHSHNDDITPDHLPWPLRGDAYYDISCSRCEHVVTLASDADRGALARVL
eukprot:635306-Pyramimonas_sp.AAC.1